MIEVGERSRSKKEHLQVGASELHKRQKETLLYKVECSRAKRGSRFNDPVAKIVTVVP